MKNITLTIVLFLSFTLVGNAQKNKSQSVDKALNILLADYSKISDLKSINTKEFIMYLSKKKLSTKGMKIKKVKQLTYITNKKEKRTIYLIQRTEGMSFNGSVSNFNTSIFEGDYQAQDDDDEIICEIVFNICKVGNCEVSCIVSDSCTGDGSSNPDCCNDVTCDEDDGSDGIKGNITEPLETLMG